MTFRDALVGVVAVPTFAGGDASAAHFKPEGTGDLFPKPLVKSFEQIAHVFPYIGPMQVAEAMVAGKEDFLEIGDDAGHDLKVRQRSLVEMFDCFQIVIALHDPAGQIGQDIFPAEIGDHVVFPRRRSGWTQTFKSTGRSARIEQFDGSQRTRCRKRCESASMRALLRVKRRFRVPRVILLHGPGKMGLLCGDSENHLERGFNCRSKFSLSNRLLGYALIEVDIEDIVLTEVDVLPANLFHPIECLFAFGRIGYGVELHPQDGAQIAGMPFRNFRCPPSTRGTESGKFFCQSILERPERSRVQPPISPERRLP